MQFQVFHIQKEQL